MKSRFFSGPAGNLDARTHGDGSQVLLLHPHPNFGGSMGSRLIHQLAIGLAEVGFQATRFNFRGVGRSEGAYSHGGGEADDALAVWDALAAESGQPPMVVGFSFGAGVAVRLANRRDVPATILIAPPARLTDTDLDVVPEAATARGSAHVISGDRDELVPLGEAQAVAAAWPRATIEVLAGADHFLTPSHHGRCVAAVRAALQELL